MRFTTRQARIEEQTHEAIDDIAEELNLSVPFYPAVYWLGRNALFEAFSFPEYMREEFKERKRLRISSYEPRTRSIIIGKDDAIEQAEEAAHFLHHVSSRFTYSGKDKKDNLAVKILDEMFAFFCSKLVVPGRKNTYGCFGPYRGTADQDELYYQLVRQAFPGFDLEEYIVHFQGYGLGDQLYYTYLEGKISSKEVRHLFLQNLRKQGQASALFIDLKARLCAQTLSQN